MMRFTQLVQAILENILGLDTKNVLASTQAKHARNSRMRIFFLLILTGLTVTQAVAADKPTRVWNLTSQTITNLQLAPAGTTAFGENQCLNDKDKSVEHDERLKVTNVETGSYDVKIGFEDGRTCFAKGVAVEAGKVFSIEDKDLKDCTK
jgi:hypothetical protein